MVLKRIEYCPTMLSTVNKKEKSAAPNETNVPTWFAFVFSKISNSIPCEAIEKGGGGKPLKEDQSIATRFGLKSDMIATVYDNVKHSRESKERGDTVVPH